MNTNKKQKMDMYFEKLVWYSTYIDCLMRVINEFLENGDSNIKPNDIPNLAEFNTKLTNRLHKIVMNMHKDWEFM